MPVHEAATGEPATPGPEDPAPGTATGPGTSESRRPARVRRWLIRLFAVLTGGFVLALLGPFGTFACAGLAERLVYWSALAALAYALYRPAAWYADRVAAGLAFPRLAVWAAAAVLASAPMTLLVWLASFRHTPSLWPDADAYLDMYWKVLLVGAGFMAVFWAAGRAGSPAPARSAAQLSPEASGGPRLAARLPRGAGAIVALQMEDHYVRVHGANGESTLLLMRLRDAVAEMDGREGMQVHRSWWVARDAVQSVREAGRNVRLVLVNGLEAPVARNTVAALREAGWLGEG